MGQLLSNLANGSLLKLAEDGKNIKFIKLATDHYGSGSGVTLIRKDTFVEAQWTPSYDTSYKNIFIGCYLDMFCNTMWPQMLDDAVKSCMTPVSIVVAEGNTVSTLHTIKRKAFPLSCTEVGLSGWVAEGTAFPHFADNAKRIACLDETATAVNWGLRSPNSDANRAYYVVTGGTLGSYYYVYSAFFAARPAFNLQSSIVVSSAPDADGCYTVESLPSSGGGVYVKNNGVWVKAA